MGPFKDEKGAVVNRFLTIVIFGSAFLDNEENYLLYKMSKSCML